ncbi:hypothetical protein N7467_005425 [Penicillium canescens]|nr:hypothetical protein N7467_005425 [Penicillium canescens]
MGNSPNELVIGWLRHHGYDSLKWTALIGGIDQTWIQYVESQKVKWWDSFKDPKYDIPLELNHTGASIDGAFHKGMTHAGDMSGWGGDLITFYGDWQAQHSYPDGHDFAINVLASGSKKSHFGLTDMIEDADAFNIAKLLSEYPDNPIYQVFNYYYQAGGGYESRFATFYRDRFGGDVANAQAAAEEILTTTDPLIMAGRAYLIVTSAGKPVLLPSLLPKRELDSFTKGFAEALARLALNG